MNNFHNLDRQCPLALLRLRAEVLLRYADEGLLALITAQRDELDRIAVTPNETDREFLGSFDGFLAQMEN